MSEVIEAKILIVGGGPGGYVAAIRAGQLGLDTVLVEGDRVGGTCLIRGCIPSKALIHVAAEFEAMARAARTGHFGLRLGAAPSLDLAETIRWKDQVVDKLNGGVAGLLKRAKVRAIEGWATFQDAKTCEVSGPGGAVTVRAEHVILATGSVPVELPFLPFGGPVVSSTEALALTRMPRRLVVVGAGYIGLELGSAFRKLGADVTVVEALDRILPGFDAELAAPVARWLSRNGVTIHLGARAKGLSDAAAARSAGAESGLVVEMAEGETLTLPADTILVTVGRAPRTGGWGLESMGVDLAGPFVKIDERCATSMRNVWAIGDVTGEPMLEHRAAAQGEMVAEIIAGGRRRFDPVSIAAVCFTEPEIVTAGLTPEAAVADGVEILTGVFPFSASGRARSMDAADDGGFVRVVARKDDHRLLGVQAVGAHVSELSAAFSLALEMGARLEDVAGTIHVHPTMSEAFHEAALRALGHAIHV